MPVMKRQHTYDDSQEIPRIKAATLPDPRLYTQGNKNMRANISIQNKIHEEVHIAGELFHGAGFGVKTGNSA